LMEQPVQLGAGGGGGALYIGAGVMSAANAEPVSNAKPATARKSFFMSSP
jgi:hypothetical protein